MRILSNILVFCLFLSFFSCEQEKKEVKKDPGMSIGNLHISKVKPRQGDSIQLRYEQLTATPEDETLHSYYTYFVDKRSYPVDIELEKSSGVYTGSLIIPDSAQAMVYHFKTGENFEANNKKGYQHVVYDSLGNPLSESEMSLANFNFYMAQFSGIEANKKEILANMSAALEKQPELVDSWGDAYGFALMREDEENGSIFLKSRLEEYSKKIQLTDKEYDKLINIYRRLKKQEQVDSVTKLAIDRFPSGEVAEGLMADQFFQNRELENQKQVYKEYLKVYGEEGRFTNFMVSSIISTAARNNDLETIKTSIPKVTNSTQSARLLNNIAWSMVEKTKTLELAEELSKKSLDILEVLKGKDTDKPDFFSHKQYADDLKGTFLMNVDTYAYILLKEVK